MKAAVVVLVLAACGGPPAGAIPPSNRGFPPKPAATPADAVFTFGFADGSADPQTGAITGLALDAAQQPIVGATIVVVSPVLQGEQVAISEENGTFKLDKLPPGHYQLVVYYGNLQRAFALEVVAQKTTTTRLTNWPIDTSPPERVDVRAHE